MLFRSVSGSTRLHDIAAATGTTRDPRLLLAVVLIAILFRVWQIAEPLWIDELHTSWVVSGEFEDVAPRARMGNQSPVYFWCVWLVTQACGHSEFSLRLSSLVAGTLAVWLAARVVIRNGGSLESGLIASALIAVDAAAIAAHYGSVSAVTFIAATNYLKAVNQPYENYATAFLAVMESPAILVGVVLGKVATSKSEIGRAHV